MAEEFKNLLKVGFVVDKTDRPDKGHFGPDGKIWYALTFGKEGQYMDPFAMSLFSMLLDGYAYFFKNKLNRDAMYDWCMKQEKKINK